MLTVKPNVLEIMLDVYSGRPNPRWFIPDDQIKTIREKIDGLPEASPVDRDILGYRGFVIKNPNRIEGIPEKIVAFNGVLEITKKEKTVYYKDEQDLEGYLLKMASELGYKKTLDHFREKQDIL